MELRYEIEATRFAQKNGFDGVYNARINSDGSEEYQAGWFDENAMGGLLGGWTCPFDDQSYGITANENGVHWSNDSHCTYDQSFRNPLIPDV